MVRVVLALTLTLATSAGCRWHFGSTGDDDAPVVPNPDAGFVVDDSGQLVSCNADTDCGRCQRCDNNYCQRATFVDVGLGQTNACALDERGEVWCWGRNDYLIVAAELPGTEIVPRPRRRTTLTERIDRIGIGWAVIYLRTTDGVLMSKGTLDGDVNDARAGWEQLYANHFNACARNTDGTVHCSGDNAWGQFGNGVTSSGAQPLTQFGTDTDWAHIAPGDSTCAVKTNGTLWCAGRNNFGQLARGATSSFETDIVQVGTDTDWAVVEDGELHACAIKTNGTLWCWGKSLVNGNAITVPTQVDTQSGWSKLESTFRCSTAWRAGVAYWSCFSSNVVASTLEGATSFAWRPMAVQPDLDTNVELGGEHGCMRRNGAWECWGNNVIGAAGVDQLAVVSPTPLCE